MTTSTRHKNEHDALKVSVTPKSASVELRGQGAGRATDALIDLISPFTNAAGWLGDQLNYVRRNAAIRAAAKAQGQLNKEGITTGKIPPKILLPWLDGASLEIDDGENLEDMWAGLFVRAVKSSDAVTISYIETLKKLGKAEAELLDFYATDTAPFYSEKFYFRDGAEIFSPGNPLLGNVVQGIESLLKSEDLSVIDDGFDTLGIQGMCQVMYYTTKAYGLRPTPYFLKSEHVIANLQHLGLIIIRDGRIKTAVGDVLLTWFEITKYAFDLVWACHGRLTGREAQTIQDLSSTHSKSEI